MLAGREESLGCLLVANTTGRAYELAHAEKLTGETERVVLSTSDVPHHIGQDAFDLTQHTWACTALYQARTRTHTETELEMHTICKSQHCCSGCMDRHARVNSTGIQESTTLGLEQSYAELEDQVLIRSCNIRSETGEYHCGKEGGGQTAVSQLPALTATPRICNACVCTPTDTVNMYSLTVTQ